MDRDWVHRSACKGLDPIIFYPATDDEADAAKAVCADCPVQTECLEHAIGHREHNGVWGGATERERQRIIRRRRRVRAMGGAVDSPAGSSPNGSTGSVTEINSAGTQPVNDEDGVAVVATRVVAR